MKMFVGSSETPQLGTSTVGLMMWPMNCSIFGSWFPGSPLPIDLSTSLPPQAVYRCKSQNDCVLVLGYNPYLVQRETSHVLGPGKFLEDTFFLDVHKKVLTFLL